MVLKENTWEEETLGLINDAQEEKKRALQRLTSAERAVKFSDERITALQLALDQYRTKYGLPKGDAPKMDVGVAASVYGKTAPEMLNNWADRHEGDVVMREICKELASVGLYQSVGQARGTLYPTVNRMIDFDKVSPGHYRKIGKQNSLPKEPDDLDNAGDNRLITVVR